MLHLGGPTHPEDILNEELAPSLFIPPAVQLKTQPPGIYICEIVDVLAKINCYLIRPPGMPNVPAVLISDCPHQMVGARDLACLTPRTTVLAYITEHEPFAVILGTVTVPTGSPLSGWSDSIVAASKAGLYNDEVHKHIATDAMSHGFLDFSAGRPVDHLPGDWGKMNELGLGIFLGRFLAFLRAADDAKLEFHYADSLTRLVGRNMELLGSGFEQLAYADEGETSVLRGVAPYLWEGLGSLAKGAAPFKEVDSAKPAENDFGVEPEKEKQMAFWRLWEAEGYLGDLKHGFVSIPASLSGYSELLGQSDVAPARIGLFEQWVGYDGRYVLRSAKSILLEKSCWIRVPEARETLDSPDGDKDFSDGPGGDVGSIVEPEENPNAELDQAYGFDLRAYVFARMMGAGFNRHTKDWFVPDFSKVVAPGAHAEESWVPQTFKGLSMQKPPSADQEIDHRTSSRYYKSRAFVDLTDDGGIILGDGYGGTISMTGGNIEFSCVGDIKFRNGRDVIIWNGGDTTIRSKKSVDISSTDESVRVKAEKMVSILGGNGGEGGLLLESRATGDPEINNLQSNEARLTNAGGIMLRAGRGGIYGWASDLYLQAQNAVMASENKLTFQARDMEAYATSSVKHVIVPAGADTKKENLALTELTGAHFTAAAGAVSLSTSRLSVANARTGRDLGSAQLLLKGSMSIDGAIQSTQGDVQKINSQSLTAGFQQIAANLNETSTEALTTLREYAAEYLTPNTGLGNDAFYTRIGFSFRDSKDYPVLLGGTTGEVTGIFEVRWQHMLTMAGLGGEFWEETEVPTFVNEKTNDAGTPTMPYPGYAAWETGKVEGQDAQFVKIEDQNYTWTPQGYRIKDTVEEVAPIMDGGAFKGRYLSGS